MDCSTSTCSALYLKQTEFKLFEAWVPLGSSLRTFDVTIHGNIRCSNPYMTVYTDSNCEKASDGSCSIAQHCSLSDEEEIGVNHRKCIFQCACGYGCDNVYILIQRARWIDYTEWTLCEIEIQTH